MEIVPMTYYNNLKRYWRRRRYQRLHGTNQSTRRPKLPIMRLGGGDGHGGRRQWKLRSGKPKLVMMIRLRKIIISPLKVLTKFHDAYVDMMVRLAGNVAHKSSGAGAFAGKKVAKTQQISTVSSTGDQELVDSRLVLEIYKRLAASRQIEAY